MLFNIFFKLIIYGLVKGQKIVYNILLYTRVSPSQKRDDILSKVVFLSP